MTDSEKRKYVSSVSDIDSSIDSSNCSTPNVKTEEKKLSKSQRRKKVKTDKIEAELSLNMSPKSIDTQLEEINEKLSHVLTKQDNTYIKTMIKETFLELKESFLAPVIKQVEVLESSIHEKAIENDNLKKEVTILKTKIDEKDTKLTELKQQINTETQKRAKVINDHEQYSRVNNVRIHGLPGDIPNETSGQTADKVLYMVNKKLNQNMPYHEIDIAHRLGEFKHGSSRSVIVRFVRRQTKSNIMSIKKKLKGSGISIFDDLTPINNEVLASTRKKLPEKIDQSWFAYGKLFVKWKEDSRIEEIKYKNFEYWQKLPWPKDGETKTD